MKLIKKFEFDSAHNLENYNGKCERLHGHTYGLVVKMEGEPDPASGMILDFVELKKIVTTEVLDIIDHTYLNDHIKQPTAENISIWIWNRLKPRLDRPNASLVKIELWETPTSGVSYSGK